MDLPKSHKIKIKQGAVKFLRDMLSGSGWAKTVSDIILGGTLLVEKVPEADEPPQLNIPNDTPSDVIKEMKNVHRLAAKTWAAVELPEFEVTEKEREAIRKCIKHFAEQGAIPPTASGAELLVAFGYGIE